MDALRFDALARSFAAFSVRRTRIDRIGPSPAPAHRFSRPRPAVACPTDRVACDGDCVNPWVFEHDAKNCGACGKVCPHTAVCCDGRCLDLTSDAKNCGVCGAACPAGSFCVAGDCV
jgi:hypothetical protein